MIQIIVLVIFIGSLIGLGIIIYRQLPTLVQLPEPTTSFLSWRERYFKIKELPFWKKFSLEKILHNFLCRIRILALKTDHQTANWLQHLREKMKKKKIEENLSQSANNQTLTKTTEPDDYWQEIKKFKNK